MSDQEKKEETRKLCPLRMMAGLIGEAHYSASALECIEERCAWWVASLSNWTAPDEQATRGRCGVAR